MKVLILGGTGNISSEVVMRLLEQGENVTILHRGKTKPPSGVRELLVDRTDTQAFRNVLEGTSFDVVADFLAYRAEDCRVCAEILSGRIGQYVFVSSATVYRKPHRTIPITEDMPLGNPFSEYAQNKIACEDFLLRAHGKDFPVTLVRPSHTFGVTWIPVAFPSSGNYTLASRIETGLPVILHDEGRSLWAATPASEFAKGFAGLLGNPAAIGEAFHVTTDEALSWNCIFQEIGMALGAEPKIVYLPSDFLANQVPELEGKLQGDKANHGVFDNRKVKKAVPDFQVQKTFREAIRESVAWYREKPERRKPDPEQNAMMDRLIEAWKDRK